MMEELKNIKDNKLDKAIKETGEEYSASDWVTGWKKHKKNTSVADFIKKRFGEGILHQFVEPFVTGIYSGNTHNMSAKHTLKFLWEAEQEYGSVIRGIAKKKKNCLMLFKIGFLSETSAPILFCMIISYLYNRYYLFLF